MHRSSNADIGGVVSLPERPNHTTRMVRLRGVLAILHNCPITRVHTTTHLSRQHATAPRTSWRFGGSSSCLDESSHPWVPAGHPQYTGASQEEGCGWLSSTHRHRKVQTTTLDINMVAEQDTTTTAPRLTPPLTPRATNPRTGGRRPENRHDRYASRNAGHVHDGTGDQASSDVTLRQQPVPVPSNRDRCASSTEQDDARRCVNPADRL